MFNPSQFSTIFSFKVFNSFSSIPKYSAISDKLASLFSLVSTLGFTFFHFFL